MPRLRSAVPDVPAGAGRRRRPLPAQAQGRSASRTPRAARAPWSRSCPGATRRELRIDESPYAGLSSFQEADADRFFGRTREIAALVTRIRDRPLLAVVGPSGVGKSSFVRAGLVPALKRSGEAWESLVIRPGRKPLAALANIVAPLVGSSTTVDEDIEQQQQLVERLKAEPGYLGSLLRSRARRERRRSSCSSTSSRSSTRWCRTRTSARPSPRAWRASPTTPPRPCASSSPSAPTSSTASPRTSGFMAELSQGLFFLTPPNREGLRDALVQPAEMAGYQFETPAMVDDMLDHLDASPGALPLLQFAAAKLWEARDTRNGCSPRAPTRPSAASPARSPATPTACSRACPTRSARWCAPSSCASSPPSARAPSSRSTSCASCRRIGGDAAAHRPARPRAPARRADGRRGHGRHGRDRPRVAAPQLAHAQALARREPGGRGLPRAAAQRGPAVAGQEPRQRPAVARRDGGGSPALPAALPRGAAAAPAGLPRPPSSPRRRRAGG